MSENLKKYHQYLIEQSDKFWEECLPHLSIDCVVFGFHDGDLKVLLLKTSMNDLWALPGGYVFKTETINDAAHRILYERTGVDEIYLQQFRVFGDLNRSEDFFAGLPDDLWNKQRFLSIGFYALVDYSKVNLVLDKLSEKIEWCSIDVIPSLMMDHRRIFDKALEIMRKQLNSKPIGLNLLPEKFTMPELQKLYECILGKKLNRGNFYRKMLRYDILIKLDEIRKGGAHKSPDLYKFDIDKYKIALNVGLNEGW
jgi:ADP-ribose pyrophosphatase YjhB (NUDIX family)